ncbi:MAG: accessory Sec system glycosylation chaperone GtfB [Lachnospiraceae bacterium]|nr:accessory Sec system glycosylation chaperone GtfB [Lachnospiraceae bacterium]
MGYDNKTDNIVFLFENYKSDTEKLHSSFKMAGMNYPVAVIDDNGFLPDDVESIYGYFLGKYEKSDRVPGKPRYFNEIKVPEYWEISGNNTSGKVCEYNKERARIYYTKPSHKRLVKTVDWLDDRGVVRSSDHYNKYGALYARTIFNAKGHKVNKSYFSATGAEIIVENYVTRDIILNEGNTINIFQSKIELVCYYLEKKGYVQKRLFYNTLSTPFFVSQMLKGHEMGDALFWQEGPREDIPGNMQAILNRQNTRTESIMVLNRHSYDRFVDKGVDKNIVQPLGYIYDFKKINNHRPEALICTNSEKIAHCEDIIKAIPDMNFTIVAITEMSSKLMSLDNYTNVTLYPNVKMKLLQSLFEKCDYYLDINCENEIVSAVETAFMHNHLIMAFNETLHNKAYVAGEHIYTMSDYERMIADIKSVMQDEKLMEKHIKMQHDAAGLEDVEEYSKLK